MKEGGRTVFNDAYDIYSMMAGSNYVSLYDVKTHVTRFSRSLVDLLGLPASMLDEEEFDWLDYIHPEDREIYDTMMKELFALRKRSYDISYRIRLADGDYSLFRLVGGVIRSEDGHPGIIGGMMIPSGVIERTDKVTSLKNLQAFLDDMLDYETVDESTSVLLVGFGRMTHINELYGYSHGSRLLVKVTEILKEIVDDRGKIYRTNGSKFAISFFSLDDEEIFGIYNAIQERYRQGIDMGDGIVHNLFAYGGYMRYEEDIAADRTMYDCLLHAYNESKRYQHGELVVYNGTLTGTKSLSGDVALIKDVRDSLINDFEGFFLQYEPVFTKNGDVPIGAEVLLKWKCEPYGVVDARSFLSEIEQDYVYDRLVNWMLKNAFRDGRDFIKFNPDFKLFFTVTQSQLWTPYFASDLEELAREFEVPIDLINIQINKDCRLLSVDKIVRFAEELRDKKVPFGIDDFARGNMYLKTFSNTQPDFVRFSSELIEHIVEKENEATILTYLVNMSAQCGTDVYIKGIGDKAVLDKLATLPVSGLQGSIFGEHVFYDEVLDYYEAKNTDNK